MNGFLCVLKPPGMTSSDVVVRVRRKLGRGAKVGHAGTLDPEASGVLPLMIGRAARLFDYLVEKEKTYVAQLKPGYATDTQDAHGAIVSGGGARATCSHRRAYCHPAAFYRGNRADSADVFRAQAGWAEALRFGAAGD